jgi:hypothetical protein
VRGSHLQDAFSIWMDKGLDNLYPARPEGISWYRGALAAHETANSSVDPRSMPP